MRIRVDDSRCEGHGRCYSIAPGVIEADDLGNGHEIGDGTVPAEFVESARKAVLNCPERAVILEEGS